MAFVINDNNGVTWALAAVSGMTLASAIPVPGVNTVRPLTMSPNGIQIVKNTNLVVDYGTVVQETVTVSAVLDGTFTATFASGHSYSIPSPSLVVGGSIWAYPVPPVAAPLPLYVVDTSGKTWQLGVLSGVTTSAASIAAGTQTVTPASMNPGGFTIARGTNVYVDYGLATYEMAPVLSVSGGTFTAFFGMAHAAAPVSLIVGGALTTTAVAPATAFPITIVDNNGVAWTVAVTTLGQIGLTVQAFSAAAASAGFPKIVWPSGGGNTLFFRLPNKDLTYYVHKSERADDYSTFGIHVAVTQRVDHFLEFRQPVITRDNDAVAWALFLDYAATGGSFDYYPDSSGTLFTTYHIIDMEMKMEYNAPGLYSIKGLRFRQVVT